MSDIARIIAAAHGIVGNAGGNLILYLDPGNINSYPGTGTIWYDLTENNNDFNINGATYNSSPGRFTFGDNEGDFISRSASDVIGGLNTLTFSGWYNLSTLQSQIAFVSYDASVSGNQFLVFKSGSSLELYWNEAVSATGSVSFPSNITVGQWFNLAVTVGTSGAEFFINGSSIGTISFTPSSIPTGGTFGFGQEQDSPGGGFSTTQDLPGSIGIVRIYNEVITSQEIADLYNTDLTVYGYDYETTYGTPDYTITSFPSTGAGAHIYTDLLVAVDGNFSTTDVGVILDLGGDGGAGTAIALNNGTMRARSFAASSNDWGSRPGSAQIEVDVSAYCNNQATYYLVADSSAGKLDLYVQSGGRGSTNRKTLLATANNDGTTTQVAGSNERGYGQISSLVADMESSYEVTFNGVIDEIRYWENGSLDVSGFATLGLARGEQVYTSPGTYSWTAPDDVISVSIVAVGGGGGGGYGDASGGGGSGGNLRYVNNISVTSGQSYTVVVGAGGASGTSSARTGTDGGDSSFNTNTVIARGGTGGSTVGGQPKTTGNVGTGGDGGASAGSTDGGGGGAGGYSGNGGTGGNGFDATQPTAGSGGAGGGGGSGAGAAGGGGVGIFGQGSNGAAGIGQPNNVSGVTAGGGGSDGLGGGSSTSAGASGIYGGVYQDGGLYGAGGGGGYGGGDGAKGAVRIVWPGITRQFPSTDVGVTE